MTVNEGRTFLLMGDRESDIAKVQRRADEISQDGFGQFQSFHTSSLSVPTSGSFIGASIPRSVPTEVMRSFAPSTGPVSMHAGSDATPERVTVLENQVAQLETNYIRLWVKLQELESSVGPARIHLAPIAGGTPSSDSRDALENEDIPPIRRPSTMMIHKIINQSPYLELPAGPEGSDGELTPKHTVSHNGGLAPSDYLSTHDDSTDGGHSDMTDVN